MTVSALFDAPLEDPAQAAGEAAVQRAGPAPDPTAVDCRDDAVPRALPRGAGAQG